MLAFRGSFRPPTHGVLIIVHDQKNLKAVRRLSKLYARTFTEHSKNYRTEQTGAELISLARKDLSRRGEIVESGAS